MKQESELLLSGTETPAAQGEKEGKVSRVHCVQRHQSQAFTGAGLSPRPCLLHLVLALPSSLLQVDLSLPLFCGGNPGCEFCALKGTRSLQMGVTRPRDHWGMGMGRVGRQLKKNEPTRLLP